MTDEQRPVNPDRLIWIDREEQAKQGMARKGDPENAKAAPDHPHTGDEQGGRQ